MTSVRALLEDAAAASPNHPGLIGQGERLTYSELASRTERLAQNLLRTGVQPGDRIALYGRNSVDYALLLLAAIRAGLVVVPLNWRLSVRELAAILTDARTSAIFVDTEFEENAAGLGVDVIHPVHAFVKNGRSILTGSSSEGPHPLHAGDDATAMLMYTSGTSGRPKGVVLSESALIAPAERATQRWGLDTTSVHLIVAPLYHASGLMNLLAGLCGRSSNMVTANTQPETILETIQVERVTNAMMVPALLRSVVDASAAGRYDLSTLRSVVFGSDRSPRSLIDEGLAALGPILTQGYGLTEASGAITTCSPHEWAETLVPDEPLTTVGRPLDDVEIRIDGASAAGDVGEILVRGPQNMTEYWGLPDETAAAFTEDGFFRTGDAGMLNDAGYLFIVGRLKELIISGGENIHPAEIERVLASHPDVADAAVVGRPDERWGEVAAAFVTLRPGHRASVDDLLRHCEEHLARYKCPKTLDVLEEFPRNSIGKIVKRDLAR